MSVLLARLPNHLGDAVMVLPALRRLATAGWSLKLAARPWAAPLLAGCGWPVVALPSGRRERIACLRAAGTDETERARGILFTNSFSSAFEFRLAGIPAAGYARDGRTLLLRDPIAVPSGPPPHMVVYYLALVDAWLRTAPAPPPAMLALPLAPGAAGRARAILGAAGITGRFCVLCPVAVGRHRGRIKAWDGFPELCKQLLARGETVVGCPGPGESEAVMRLLAGATVLAPTDLATFAAILAQATLVVANDSGPGHLAAAVGAPLVSVFGVTEPEVTQPWGPNVVRVGSAEGWPDLAAVAAAVTERLSGAVRS